MQGVTNRQVDLVLPPGGRTHGERSPELWLGEPGVGEARLARAGATALRAAAAVNVSPQ